MTKKVKWIVITAVLLLVVIGVGFAIDAIVWDNINNEIFFKRYYDDRVEVGLDVKYNEEVYNQEFRKEDFHVDNIDRIEYDSSVIIFYLKKGGIRNCKKAMMDLMKLECVNSVGFVPYPND